ncbi:MAG: stalk domain-containing protein [Anaerovoracaceae bacterium]
MLKKKIMRAVAGVLVMGLMMSSAAFADTGSSSMPVNTVSGGQVQTSEAVQSEYIAKEGTVSSVTKHDNYYSIEVKASDSDELDVIYNVSPDTYTFSQIENGVVSLDSIKEGMKISAVMSQNVPMTMSLPPHISDVSAFVIMGEGFAEVSYFNNELINAENTLKLNISEKTNILNTNGTKMLLNAEDVKNHDCIVLYTSSTRSIPAQTTPETVIILSGSAEADTPAVSGGNEDMPVIQPGPQTDDKYVELRKEAEAKGYKVEWTGNKKPIVLTKNDMRVEITQNSTDFSFTHKTRDIKPLDRMEKMAMSVKLENGRTMVAKSFIDALE